MMKTILNMSVVNIKSKISSLINQNSDSALLVAKNNNATPSILSKSLKIRGDLVSSGMIEIEGIVDGNISSNSIILREDAEVEGEMIAESVIIKGSFRGNIRAKNINISSKAKVFGAIEYVCLAVEDGASIEGQFKKLEIKPSS
jgi:cytoskeletal protein CcmA (bactofilin family)